MKGKATGRGNKIPKELAKARGTYRPYRNDRAEVEVDAVKYIAPPEGLSERELELWDMLFRFHGRYDILIEQDAPLVYAYVKTWSRYYELQELIDNEVKIGERLSYIKASSGVLKDAISLSTKLYFTPPSRIGVALKITDSKRKQDEFDDI